MSNLSLWQSVEKTDPAYTKGFQKGGGFSGTAVNATWLARRATEAFGPIGIGWGVQVIGQHYANGAPLLADGVVVGNEIVHTVHIRLWYVRDGVRGEIEHIGCTTFVGSNKKGFFSDEDHAKKSLTDATTKALSLLGFGADIHLGRYDDNKYVANLRREFSEGGSDGDGDGGAGTDDAAFTALHNALKQAAEKGMQALVAKFKATPTSDTKADVWAKHGESLKGIALKADAEVTT